MSHTEEKRPAVYGTPLVIAHHSPAPIDSEITAVVARGEIHGPAGRRHLPLIVVRRCPFCDCAHAHRGAPGGVRRAGCGSGEYLLDVRPVIV